MLGLGGSKSQWCAASSSLDPVFSIKQQFQQILDRHGFEGDADEIAAASVKSVGLYPDV